MEEKGFTLIENLVALVVLTLLAGTVLVLFTQSSKMSNRAREITTATFLAQDKIEEFKGTPFDLLYSMVPFEHEEEIISNKQEFLRQTYLTLESEVNIKVEVIVKTKKGREICLAAYKKCPQIEKGLYSD